MIYWCCFSHSGAIWSAVGIRTTVALAISFLKIDYATLVSYVLLCPEKTDSIFCLHRAIKRSDCFHADGDSAPCRESNFIYMVFFGIVQVILSQIPNFDRLWWLSIVAAIMSFSYSTIGLGLGLGKASGNLRNTHLWNHIYSDGPTCVLYLMNLSVLFGCLFWDACVSLCRSLHKQNKRNSWD
jgi:hypothetical protein